MRFSRRWLVLLAALLWASPCPAQVVIGPGGIGIGGTLRTGRLNIGLSAVTPGYGYYPPFYPYGYGRSTTILQFYSPPPPAVVFVPAAPAFPRFNYVEEPLIRPGQQVPLVEVPPRDAPPPLPPGVPAGEFRPIRPEDRAKALAPVLVDPPRPPAVKPMPPEKPRAEDPPKARPPARLLLPPQSEDDPKAEYTRQLALGRAAFANQEYGRALTRLRQAVAVLPVDPTAHFLLGQTFFAMGKYAEAVEAIQAGMRLHPDWPQAAFRPLELYEPNVALYPEQLGLLEQTLARHPKDPSLLFLYAYQLWFDGRKDEARALFQRALPLAPERTFIERFLQALPAPAIV